MNSDLPVFNEESPTPALWIRCSASCVYEGPVPVMSLTCVSRLGAHEEEEKERRKTNQDESNVKVLVNVWLKPDQPMPPKLPIERTPVHVGRYVYFVLCSMPLHMNNLFSIEYIVPVDLYAWFKVNQK